MSNADPVKAAQSVGVFHEGLRPGPHRSLKCSVMQTARLVAVVLALLACNPAEAQPLGGDTSFPVLCTPVHIAGPDSQSEVKRTSATTFQISMLV